MLISVCIHNKSTLHLHVMRKVEARDGEADVYTRIKSIDEIATTKTALIMGCPHRA